MCAEFENTRFQQIWLFVAHFLNNLGGGNQTYKFKKLGLKTKYTPETDFFILKHILDFRYLKYLKMDLTLFFNNYLMIVRR